MSNFWQGKRVVVTGGAGFLGRHVCLLLKEHGAAVVSLDNYSQGRHAIPGVDNYNDDAAKMAVCQNIFYGADAVFNLAAKVAGVFYNQTHNTEMFYKNVALQSIPILAAEELKTPHFLQVSSVCVYAEGYNSPSLESNGQAGDPVAENNGYAWAKRMGERAALWSSLPHVVVARPSNMYGPFDHFDNQEAAHVIPRLVNRALGDYPDFELFNGGTNRREFLYVEDAAAGLLHLLEHGQHRETYNLGTNGRTSVSMGDLIDAVQTAAGTNKPKRNVVKAGTGDNVRWSDCDKLEALGFLADTTLQEGIGKTVAWRKSTLLVPQTTPA